MLSTVRMRISTQLIQRLKQKRAQRDMRDVRHTSAVQAPEFEGWKKLSVEAINFTSESRAFEPPT